MAAGTRAAIARQGLDVSDHDAAVWMLGGCAVILALFSVGALLVARGLRRRTTAGRAGALMLAIPNLIAVPFGTALGFYAFWVLLNNDARREFGRPLRGPTPIDTAG